MSEEGARKIMSKKSIISIFSLIGLLTLASSDFAQAIQTKNTLPPTVYNLGTGLFDYGISNSPEYEKLLARLTKSEKQELFQVQKEYLNDIAHLKVELREKQKTHNLYLREEGSSSRRIKEISADIDKLERQWISRTNEFRRYLQKSYNSLISTNSLN